MDKGNHAADVSAATINHSSEVTSVLDRSCLITVTKATQRTTQLPEQYKIEQQQAARIPKTSSASQNREELMKKFDIALKTKLLLEQV